jgi:excisionase family DNA binding protein
MAKKTHAKTAPAARRRRQQRTSRAATIRQPATPVSAAEVSSAVHAVLEAAPASVKAGFVEAVTRTARERDLDESLWGSAPSAAELRTAALQALKDDFIARRELLHASLSRAEVAELLGISSQAVLDQLAHGDLVGLKDGREWRIPMWQVNAGAERGFLPGISDLRRVFPGGVVSLSRWAVTPNVDLGDMTPADALAAGHVQDVIAVATKTTAAAW